MSRSDFQKGEMYANEDVRAGNAAIDLESFAKHAGRSTIKTDDVMLLTRRNEGLEGILKDELVKLDQSKKKSNKSK